MTAGSRTLSTRLSPGILQGILSGFMYLSMALSVGFLVPIQYAFSRHGKRGGLLAALSSVLVIGAGQLARLSVLSLAAPLPVAAGLATPFALIAAICAINSFRWKIAGGWRVVIVSTALALAAAYFVFKATRDGEFLSWVSAAIKESFAQAGQEEDISAVIALAVGAAVEVVQSAFAPLILLFMAGSWWTGTRFAEKRQALSSGYRIVGSSSRLENIRIPGIFLWPTLASWAVLFAILITKTKGPAAAAAWNCSLYLASLYGAQGLGILKHLSGREKISPFLRLLPPLVLLASVLSPVAASVVLIALPVLGITEVWLPYRNLKGA